MPRRAEPIENTLAWEIRDVLLSLVDKRQIIPNEHALFIHMKTDDEYKEHYEDMTIDSYRYYFRRLCDEGYVKIDILTRALSIPRDRRIVPAD